MSTSSDKLIADLFGSAESRPALASTAERVADMLRGYLTEGRIAPGTRMSEEAFAKALSVSRNTLREAFRLLGHEGLLVHELNRGVFVREFTRTDVNDIYDLRELIELAAVSRTAKHTPEGFASLRESLAEGARAAAVEDWQGVGTHNLEFHRRLCELMGSDRINKLMRGILAESRLAFRVMTNVEAMDSPYLSKNELICDHLEAGRSGEAVVLIQEYLSFARGQLLDALPQNAD
ncbi:GntR family transcriptional regulator [Nocardioides yefusunii]|uniref:GntR family transcriptional regulator n=1 Tax=Nocardioides yefusunii TaxID=2500546 RepID=A0ABW1QXE6_9ACTN|nr:GntR family transcriptional regulator [Nocardioides yefusunii]